MGIDHVIDLDCIPKQTLSTAGIAARLKAQQRAAAVIKLYRDRGDYRPPQEIGFEMVRRTADGSEEVQVIIVQDLLDQGAALESLAKHCQGCPANLTGKAFGCFGYINYPLSPAAEIWLLKQLPGPDIPLVFLLLRQTLTDSNLQGTQVAEMRQRPGVFFQGAEKFGRRFDEFTITTDQVFELIFLQEVIRPLYAALLLLLFSAIPRDYDAQKLMELTPARPDQPLPFTMQPDPADDKSIADLKTFFAALHRAHQLNVSLSLDA